MDVSGEQARDEAREEEEGVRESSTRRWSRRRRSAGGGDANARPDAAVGVHPGVVLVAVGERCASENVLAAVHLLASHGWLGDSLGEVRFRGVRLGVHLADSSLLLAEARRVRDVGIHARVDELAAAVDDAGHAIEARARAKGAHERAELVDVERAATVGVEAVEGGADVLVGATHGEGAERLEGLAELESPGPVRVERLERRVAPLVELRVRLLHADGLVQNVAEGGAEDASERSHDEEASRTRRMRGMLNRGAGGGVRRGCAPVRIAASRANG